MQDVPESCGFLMHLHALVNRRGHFMPQGVEADHLVRGKWVLSQAGGSGQVLFAGSSDVAAHLQNVTYCDALRKAAAKVPGKAVFSAC
jgi:hypothetical protein